MTLASLGIYYRLRVVNNLTEANAGFTSCSVPETSLLEYSICKSTKKFLLMASEPFYIIFFMQNLSHHITFKDLFNDIDVVWKLPTLLYIILKLYSYSLLTFSVMPVLSLGRLYIFIIIFMKTTFKIRVSLVPKTIAAFELWGCVNILLN